MRVPVIASAVLMLGMSVSGLASGRTLAPGAESALGCKLAGIRYSGAAPGKAKVCFTLSANRKLIREYAYDVCQSAKTAATPNGRPKPFAVRSDGTFSSTFGALAAGEAGLGWINVTFRGRVKGVNASGSLTGATPEGTRVFGCAWTARRVSG